MTDTSRPRAATTWLLFLAPGDDEGTPRRFAERWIPRAGFTWLPSAAALRRAWRALCHRHPDGIGPHTLLSAGELRDVATEAGMAIPSNVAATPREHLRTLHSWRQP